MHAKTAQQFLVAALKIGQSYLSYGGSISKLESHLTKAGEKLNLRTSVHATPAGITISYLNTTDNDSKSLFVRVDQLTPHMSKLAFNERLLGMFSRGVISPEKLLSVVRKGSAALEYPPIVIFSAIFVIGFSTSYNFTVSIFYGLTGGATTLLAYFLGRTFNQFFHLQSTVKDFVICFFAISLSILTGYYLQLHPSQLFIGTIAMILPGLTITSAVGDFIEEHYQTGLVKLAKAALTLLSIGFSYVLSIEWMASIGWVSSTLVIAKVETPPSFISSFISTVSMIVSFCCLLQVPLKAMGWCLVGGLAGWIAFESISSASHPFAAPFISAFLISALTRISSHWQKLVPQIYIVPGLLVLTPGLLAFSYLQPLLDVQSVATATRSIILSVMVAVALAFGLMLGQLRLMK